MDHHWRRDPENRRLFMEILKQPEGITHALRLDEPDQRARAISAEFPAYRRTNAA